MEIPHTYMNNTGLKLRTVIRWFDRRAIDLIQGFIIQIYNWKLF